MWLKSTDLITGHRTGWIYGSCVWDVRGVWGCACRSVPSFGLRGETRRDGGGWEDKTWHESGGAAADQRSDQVYFYLFSCVLCKCHSYVWNSVLSTASESMYTLDSIAIFYMQGICRWLTTFGKIYPIQLVHTAWNSVSHNAMCSTFFHFQCG